MEIVTNGPDAVPYWDAMMALNGTKGYARYVPLSPLGPVTVSDHTAT